MLKARVFPKAQRSMEKLMKNCLGGCLLSHDSLTRSLALSTFSARAAARIAPAPLNVGLLAKQIWIGQTQTRGHRSRQVFRGL